MVIIVTNIVHNSKVKVLYSVIFKYSPTQPFIFFIFYFFEAIFKRLRHVSHIKMDYFIKVTKSFDMVSKITQSNELTHFII